MISVRQTLPAASYFPPSKKKPLQLRQGIMQRKRVAKSHFPNVSASANCQVSQFRRRKAKSCQIDAISEPNPFQSNCSPHSPMAFDRFAQPPGPSWESPLLTKPLRCLIDFRQLSVHWLLSNICSSPRQLVPRFPSHFHPPPSIVFFLGKITLLISTRL